MDFRRLRGQQDLHVYLGTTEDMVVRLLSHPNDLFERHFIPKKGASEGAREVWEVRDTDVADVYKGLSRKLWEFFKLVLHDFPHRAAHGYIPGRSTLTNARPHLGAERLLRGDIQSFFRSISAGHVVGLLERAGVRKAAAEALAGVVVHENHIPLGLHTSPILANAVCHDLDKKLAELVPGGQYTRYADDLTFSGPALPRKEDVSHELKHFGFALSERKWRLVRQGRGLYVTGLSLEDRERPRAARDLKRRLRQDLHYAAKHGLERHVGRRGYSSVQSGINKIDGTIRYLRGIEPTFGKMLHEKWAEILVKEGRTVGYQPLGGTLPRDVLFLLDESVVDGPAGRVMVLGLAVVEDPDVIRVALQRFLAEREANPYSGTPKEVLADEGIHWNRLTPDDRTRATDQLMGMPFRAFIAFATISKEDRNSYDAEYGRLLATVLEGRFIRYDGCRIRVIAEENSKVKGNTLANVVRGAYEAAAAKGFRKPLAEPAHQTVAKATEAALPLPDLLLGVFGDYARSAAVSSGEAGEKKKQASGAQATLRFEQIRDKIRAIYDVDTGAVYSRKKKFAPWKPTR